MENTAVITAVRPARTLIAVNITDVLTRRRNGLRDAAGNRVQALVVVEPVHAALVVGLVEMTRLWDELGMGNGRTNERLGP